MEQFKDYRSKYIPKYSRSNYLVVTFPNFFHQYYSKKNKDGEYIEDYNLARKVIESIFLKVFKEMILNHYILKMPYKLGMIYIADNITHKGFFRDWNDTFERGGERIILKYNHTTNGTSPRIRWMNLAPSMSSFRYYRFKPIRGEAGEYYGYRGLWSHVKETFKNPFKRNFRGHLI